ncbi:hypothetical protein GCM10010171_08260 [Actinokineospora fastidiosa]|uniref:Uncharacterized protein n=1 Tax=Actinokineospora fastidiosa TaxID=1816 RepID=A0A918L7Q3_9PSEU|nr:hypothetical protein GCM10010171_08260 [Actinokineospora fastidiosa]
MAARQAGRGLATRMSGAGRASVERGLAIGWAGAGSRVERAGPGQPARGRVWSVGQWGGFGEAVLVAVDLGVGGGQQVGAEDVG